MNISVLIRLMPATRTAGRLAGQAEIVETGQTFVFAGEDEVIALLDRVAAGTVQDDPATGDPDAPGARSLAEGDIAAGPMPARWS